MTTSRRDRRADNAKSGEPTPERSPKGRFAKGFAAAKPRPPARSSITSALRSRVDPERIAEILLDLLEDPKTNARDRIQVAALITDRLEGKAIARSISITSDIDGAVLAGMDPAQRMAFLGEIRARRMLGEATISDDESDESQGGNDDE